MPNIFETLLTDIAEADREIFSGIAERNPGMKTYIADPQKVARVDEVENWYAANWDFENNCTKAEHARGLRIQGLEEQLAAQVASGNNNKEAEAMTFEQLNTFLDEKITEGKVLSPNQMKAELKLVVDAKDAEFNAYINRVAAISTEVPYLNQLHQRDLGEMFDPNDLLTKANEAKAIDLRDYYFKTYSADARTAKAAKESEATAAANTAALAAAREEGRKAALQERVGETGLGNPSSDGEADMGHLQLKLMHRAAPKPGEDGKPVEINSPLGTGITAGIRAREFERGKISGSAA